MKSIADMVLSDMPNLKETRTEMQEVISDYFEETGDIILDEPEVFDEVVNQFVRAQWKRKALTRLMKGDREGMVQDVLPEMQFRMIELAMEAGDEKVRADMSKFVMSQAGAGTVTKIHHEIGYEAMSEDQLQTVIASRLAQIKKSNPAFDMSRVLQITGTIVPTQESGEDKELEDIAQPDVTESSEA